MTFLDALKLLAPMMGSILVASVYLGRKLEEVKDIGRQVEELKAEKLPARVTRLETLAGAK